MQQESTEKRKKFRLAEEEIEVELQEAGVEEQVVVAKAQQ